MLSDEKLREIRESVDLVAFISEYVPLRRQGQRFVGLCPFHNEKSPSFGVSRGKDFYYCFGCHATGDAITFVRHIEGLGFMEAVEKLAERSGIEIPRTDDVGQQELRKARARRDRLSELMALAQSFFEEQLHTHPHADIARAELDKRKVSPESAETFHLGYAPAAWDGLAQHFARQRVDLDEAAELGLILKRNQGPGYFDRFRHRLMFPVADQHGRVIAFSGRALTPPAGEEEREKPAKYINSPEGPLYKKGQALFGLSTARVAMRKHNRVLLCEGNFDLVGIHQAGFEHVLAPLGTAFTLEQAKLIRRFCEEVVVVFDGDNAGRKATAVAFELLQQAGLKGRAVRLPDGQDPDSYLSEHGAEAFARMVDGAPAILDFLINEAALYAVDAPSRARAIQRLLPYVNKVADVFERDLYIEQLAKKFDIADRRRLRAELRKDASPARDPGAQRGGRENQLRAEAAREGAAGAMNAPQKPQVRMRGAHELPGRQRGLLGAMLDHPELFGRPEAARFAELLTDSDLRAIFLDTAQMLEQRGEFDALALLEGQSGNAACAWLADCLNRRPSSSLEIAEGLFSASVQWLEQDYRQAQRKELTRKIQLATQMNDGAQVVELMRLRNELAKT